jgi:WD40 repeat protein
MLSPFKFLDSYTKEDKDIFFGRDTEIEELYKKCFDSRILVVYGISGTGKSSLINCGLANKFNDADWLPLNMRRAENINASLARAIEKNALSPVSVPVDNEKAILKALKSLYLDHFKPIFLIVDQLEELFIFGSKSEKEQFISIVKTITDSDIQCRFIFVIREEYLASTNDFEKSIPVFLDNRLRIEKMTRQNAVKAIEGPCQIHDIRVEAGFSESLLDKLSPGTADVELTYLQVYLDKIYRTATASENNSTYFSYALLTTLGDVHDLLGSFLDEQIAQLSDPEAALVLLKSFVSVQGTKRQISQEDALEYAKTLGKLIEPEKVQELIQHFIALRILQEQDENHRYELRHDALAAKIYEKITLVEKELLEVRQFIENSFNNFKKRNVLLSDHDLKYIAPWERKLFLPPHLQAHINNSKLHIKKRMQKVQRASIIGILLFFGITTGIVYFSVQKLTENISTENATIAILMKKEFPADAFRIALETYDDDTTSFPAIKALFETFLELYKDTYVDTAGNIYYPCKSIFDFTPCDTTIEKIHVSRDNKKIIGLLADNSLKVWDISGKEEYTIEPLASDILAFQISPDNNYSVCLTEDSILHLFDTSATELMHFEIRYSAINTDLAFDFSSDKKYLAINQEEGISIIDLTNIEDISISNKKNTQGLDTNYITQKLPGKHLVGLEFSADSRFLVSYDDNTPSIWYYHKTKKTFQLFDIFSDYNFLDENDSLRDGIDIQGRKILRSCHFSADSKFIISAYSNIVFIWGLDRKIYFVYVPDLSESGSNALTNCIDAGFTMCPGAITFTYLKDTVNTNNSKQTALLNFQKGWDADPFNQMMVYVEKNDSFYSRQICFSKDGHFAARTITNKDLIHLMWVYKAKKVITLKGSNPVFINDGDYLVYISENQIKMLPGNEKVLIDLVLDKKIFGTLKYIQSVPGSYYSL